MILPIIGWNFNLLLLEPQAFDLVVSEDSECDRTLPLQTVQHKSKFVWILNRFSLEHFSKDIFIFGFYHELLYIIHDPVFFFRMKHQLDAI